MNASDNGLSRYLSHDMRKIVHATLFALTLSGCDTSPRQPNADEIAMQVSDEEMRDEYNRIIASYKGMEYRVSHILLMTEQDAKDVLNKIAQGERFSELAAALSRDAQSARDGGDLGWTAPQQFGLEIEAALEQRRAKGLFETPVRSKYGWHVLKVTDLRPPTFPAFEEVKEEIRMRMTRRIRQLTR